MRLHLLTLACAVLATACYSGARAARDVNVAWRGHARVELEARLGTPREAVAQPDGTTLLRWTRRGQSVEQLPGGDFRLEVTSTSVDLHAEVRPGVVRAYERDVASAVVDGGGTVVRFEAGGLAAGIPRGRNLRTGVVMGLHGGLSRLDDAASPLPSVGAYIGGMLGPRLALVGSYDFANGTDGDDYVNGHAWAMAVKYWPLARLSLHAGPAMVLDVDPGPADLQLAPGAVAGVSVAVVRAGAFVLDLRVDATVSTASAFAAVGLGVNLN